MNEKNPAPDKVVFWNHVFDQEVSELPEDEDFDELLDSDEVISIYAFVGPYLLSVVIEPKSPEHFKRMLGIANLILLYPSLLREILLHYSRVVEVDSNKGGTLILDNNWYLADFSNFVNFEITPVLEQWLHGSAQKIIQKYNRSITPEVHISHGNLSKYIKFKDMINNVRESNQEKEV